MIEKQQTAKEHSQPQSPVTKSDTNTDTEEEAKQQGTYQNKNMNQQIYQDVHLEEQPTTNVHQESNHEQYMDQGADQM